MKNFIQNRFRFFIVLLISSIGLSSCVVHETSHHRSRPVVIVKESHPRHNKHNNKYKNKHNNKYKDKHYKQKKHKNHRGDRD